MRWHERRSVVAIVPFIAGAVMAATSGRPPEAPCVVAKRWASENAGHFPTALGDFSRHTPSYRRAIYRALPRDAKLSLWHEQFRAYAASPALSEAQRRFVLEIDADLDTYFGPENVRQFKQRYGARAHAILGDSLSWAVLRNLGMGAPRFDTPNGKSLGNLDTCGCNTGESYCGGGPSGPSASCNGGGCTIDDVWPSCGNLWCEDCNGKCGAAT
jgi:hypothetical protein